MKKWDKKHSKNRNIRDGEELLSFIEEMVPKPVEKALAQFPKCSICFNEFKNKDQIRVLTKCKHPFHATCLDKWLTEFSATCPIDKQKVDPHSKIL